jgi:hypothetical protein
VAKVKYDLSDVEDVNQAHAPVGVYRAKISKVDGPKPSSSGNSMLEVIFDLTHDAAGKSLNGSFMPVWYYPLLAEDAHPVSKARTKEFMLAVGLKAKGTLDTDKLVGKDVQLRLKSDTDQDGDYRPKIGKVMALPEQDEPEDEAEPDEAEDEEEMDLDALDRAGLKAVIKEEGLDVKVLKKMSDDDIRKAIIAAWPEDEEEEDEPEDEEEEDEAEEEEEAEDEAEDDGYDDMSVADLKAELKERELPTNGARKVLIARLRTDDEKDPI